MIYNKCQIKQNKTFRATRTNVQFDELIFPRRIRIGYKYKFCRLEKINSKRTLPKFNIQLFKNNNNVHAYDCAHWQYFFIGSVF